MTDQLLSLVRQLTISQRIGIGFGALLSVLLLVGLVMWAGQPQMQVAFKGLSTDDAAMITEALDGAGIPYELTNAGTVIRVPSKDLSEAKVAAGQAGYAGDSNEDFSIFDEQGFGASEFQQDVAYQRALEGKLTTTIEDMEGVADATVSIVQRETGVLSSGDSPATASVVVNMTGGLAPSDALVSGIVHTVAGAVSGLTPANVTVVDINGTVLAGPDGTPGNALAMQGQVERTIALKVQAILDAALGPGHSKVAVSAELDLDKVEKTVTEYTPMSTDTVAPVSVQQSEELYGPNANAAGTGGIPGTYSNVPGLPTYPNATAAPNASPSAVPGEYVKRDSLINYATGSVVSSVIGTPGNIRRLSVSVLLDSAALTETSAEQLQPAIESAAGYVNNDVRQDSLSVVPVKFATPPVEEVPQADMFGAVGSAVPQILGGIAAFLLLFLVWRNMRALRGRAEDYQLATARAQSPLLAAGDELAMAQAAPSMFGDAHLEEELIPTSPQARIQERIRLMAEDKPDELAGLVNTWLREDDKAPRRR